MRSRAAVLRVVGHKWEVVEVGAKADLNVIDYDALGLEQPRLERDLPAGGRRLHQGAVGYRATIVGGQCITVGGRATGRLPGRLVRGRRDGASC
jgi:N-acyl-D-aspartate/D-glutamate deacylase